MQFANPAYLFLALLVPPLLWWWLRQQRSSLRLPAIRLLVGLPAGRAWRARWGGALLRALALLALVVALAGPRWPDLRTRIETEGVALVMVVDVSGSMAEEDFDWQGSSISRLEAVRRVYGLFVTGTADENGLPDGAVATEFTGRPTDLIGLVTFATRPDTACPLTLSHSVLLRLLKDEKPRRISGESSTNLSDAIALGLHRLQSAGPRHKVLVLLTDGEHNVPKKNTASKWTPRQAAQVAASLNVSIYTIDAGSGTGSTKEQAAPTEAQAGEDSPAYRRMRAIQTLEQVAHISGGQYFQAGDSAALLRACQTIDRLERSDIQSFQYRRYHEGYTWFALASFLALALAVALDLTVWRRLP